MAAQMNKTRSLLVLVVDDFQDAAVPEPLRHSGHQVRLAYNGHVRARPRARAGS